MLGNVFTEIVRYASLCIKATDAPNSNLIGFKTLRSEYCAGGKIEKNEMGGACGAYGGGERGAQGSGGEI